MKRNLRPALRGLALAVAAVGSLPAHAASGNLSTNSPCNLPGPNGADRCTVAMTIASSGTNITCVWATNPTQLHACGGSNFTADYEWATTAGRVLELRAHNNWPTSDPGWPGAIETIRANAPLLDSETVIAQTPNVAPTVSLTAPANGAGFTAPAAFTLTANAADSDGTVARVEFYQNGSLLGSDTSAPYSWALSGVAAGSYTYSARAVDNRGAVATSANAAVTVTQPSNASGTLGNTTCSLPGPEAPDRCTVTLTVNSINSPLVCIWALSPTQLFACNGPGNWTVAWPYVTAASRRFELRAHNGWPTLDPQWPSGADTIRANAPLLDFKNLVASSGNQAPSVAITAPTNGANFSAPATFTISANAADNDGSVASVEFFAGSLSLGVDAFPPFALIWSGVAQGNYALTARAVDNQGAATTSAAVNVSVGPPVNQQPTASIASPGNGASFLTPAIVRIQANAADGDDAISRVDFVIDGAVIASDNSAPYEYVWRRPNVGNHSVVARAISTSGQTADSAARTVSITNFSSSVAQGRGGANYYVYKLDYQAAPNGREPFGVLVNYNDPAVRSTVIGQLNTMQAEGQRRMRTGIFYVRGGSSGIVTDTTEKFRKDGTAYYLNDQFVLNLKQFLRDLSDAGFQQVILAMHQQGGSNPYAWTTAAPPNAATYDLTVRENIGVIGQVRAAAVAVRAEGYPIEYLIDLGNELVPETGRPAQHMQFVQAVWNAYRTAYGTADTVGFSFNLDGTWAVDNRLGRAREAYGTVFPAIFDMHIYGVSGSTEYDTYTRANSKVNSLGIGGVPWVIGETWYQDNTSATNFTNAINNTGRRPLFLLEWPRFRGDTGCAAPPAGPSNPADCQPQAPLSFSTYILRGY